MVQHNLPPINKVSTKGSYSAVDSLGVTLTQLANVSYMLIMILPPDWWPLVRFIKGPQCASSFSFDKGHSGQGPLW